MKVSCIIVNLFLAWDDPYLLGVVHDTLEVYTMEGCLHVQTIQELNKARLIFHCKQGKIYVASTSQVWCIKAVDLTQQIRTLLDQNQFQLALKLAVDICLFFSFNELMILMNFRHFRTCPIWRRRRSRRKRTKFKHFTRNICSAISVLTKRWNSLQNWERTLMK